MSKKVQELTIQYCFPLRAKARLEDWLVLKLSHQEMAQHINLKLVIHKNASPNLVKNVDFTKNILLKQMINMTIINEKVRLFSYYIAIRYLKSVIKNTTIMLNIKTN